MNTFFITLINVAIMLVYMIPGFILRKFNKVSENHLSTLSTILVYVLSPCMIAYSFLSVEFTPEGFGMMAAFGGATLVLQALFILILFLILRTKFDDAKYRIFTVGSVLGNVGFFGLPLVKALLPNNPEVACYSCIYVVTMNILVFTVGVFCLTKEKKFISIKTILINPATISLVVALPLYFFGVRQYLPTEIMDAVTLLGKATTPVCMLILGIRLASVNFKNLFTRPFIYLLSIAKMVVFPLFCYLCVVFLPIDTAFKQSILILSAVPCASVILNLAEMHHAEEELAANSVLVSTLLCIVTIPVVLLLLQISI